MADKLELALIGCGGMMGAHVKNGYRPLWEAGYHDFQIVACCDVVEAAASRMSGAISEWHGHTPSFYTDVEKMLAGHRGLAAVDIVVTHSEHHRLAVPLLEAGKHVMIEKPLAMTMRAGKQILEAAAKQRVVLSVAENYRRSPSQRACNWALKSGRIGQLRQLYWIGCRERRWYWGWRDDLDLAGGGWTFDGGVHSADLFHYHIGQVRRLTALSRQYDTLRFRDRENQKDEVQATVEDMTMALLEFENGVSGVWVETITAPGKGLGTQVIYGDEGSLDCRNGLHLRGQEEPTTIEALNQEFLGQLSSEESERLFPLGLKESVAHEVHEFVEACLRGGPVETDGLEGYKAQAICMGIYESATLGSQPVELSKIEALEIENYQAPLNKTLGIE